MADNIFDPQNEIKRLKDEIGKKSEGKLGRAVAVILDWREKMHDPMVDYILTGTVGEFNRASGSPKIKEDCAAFADLNHQLKNMIDKNASPTTSEASPKINSAYIATCFLTARYHQDLSSVEDAAAGVKLLINGRKLSDFTTPQIYDMSMTLLQVCKRLPDNDLSDKLGLDVWAKLVKELAVRDRGMASKAFTPMHSYISNKAHTSDQQKQMIEAVKNDLNAKAHDKGLQFKQGLKRFLHLG
jgi:hypothetical protein